MMVMVELLLIGLVLVIDSFVLARLIYTFKLLRFSQEEHAELSQLPTVSICITARNETHAMTKCLERVVATEYPKLEIIVLDDGSRDNTSILIKSFAHAGVRFVEGTPLPDGWLGKNHAQSVLAHEASGKYVFFMDVDTQIERHTVMRTVSYLMNRNVLMASFIPIRASEWRISTLMATMRYFWAMVRFTTHRPRAVSNAWLIDRKFLLNELKTNETLPASMLMETTIARKLALDGSYRLAMGNEYLGIRFEKKWSSQIETSIRLLYPQCDAYVLQALWLVVLLTITLVPYVMVWWNPWALIPIIIQYAIASFYLSKVWSRYRWVGAFILPVTIAQEIALYIVSVYKYKFGTVTWKGRPVQAPRRG